MKTLRKTQNDHTSIFLLETPEYCFSYLVLTCRNTGKHAGYTHGYDIGRRTTNNLGVAERAYTEQCDYYIGSGACTLIE